MKFFILIFIFIQCNFNLLAQRGQYTNHRDSLILEKRLFGANIYQNGRNLSFKELKKITSDFPRANRYIKRAQIVNTANCILASLGIVIFFASFNGNAPGQIANWPVTSLGVGLVGASILINSYYEKCLQIGVDSYNKEK